MKIKIQYILGIWIGLLFICLQQSIAATGVPRTIDYQGRLLDNTRHPITTGQTIRFSLWSDSDFQAWEITGSGSINTISPAFGGWQEKQTIMPNQYGIFSVQIGKIVPLPNLDFNRHKFLQVEVKPSSAPDTAYEVLDPTGNLNDANDRKPLNSAFYALNTERLNNKKIGTGSGDLAILGVNGRWWINFMPEGTNSDFFTIDYDNSATNEVILKFGQALNNSLIFDILKDCFVLSNDLKIKGNLNVNGNQINLNAEGNADTDVFILAKQASGSGWVIQYNASSDSWQLSNSGSSFSEIVTASFGQTLTNKIIDADQNTLLNIDWNSLENRTKIAQFIPEYNGVTLYGDGSHNSGTMFADYEDNGGENKHNYYAWETRKNVIQDYDLAIRYQLPPDFESFTAIPIILNLKTESTDLALNKIDFNLENWSGTTVPLNGNINLVSLSNNTWRTVQITFVDSPSFLANEFITIRIKLSATRNATPYVGEMLLYYLGK